jgi:endonuclease/exonuclease/phosphatase family metal-dependent hydrolase
LRAAGLRDTYRDVHPGAGPVGTFHAFRGGLDGEKIDAVLASSPFATDDATILTQPAPSGRYVSDHHPVAATLRLPAAR